MHIKSKIYYDRAQRGPWVVAFSQQSVQKVPKLAISDKKQGSNFRNLIKIGMDV